MSKSSDVVEEDLVRVNRLLRQTCDLLGCVVPVDGLLWRDKTHVVWKSVKCGGEDSRIKTDMSDVSNVTSANQPQRRVPVRVCPP